MHYDSDKAITASGVVEDLDNITGVASCTEDGKYVVWIDGEKLYRKQPTKDPIMISTNADGFCLNRKTGELVIFATDGVYYAKDLESNPTKFSTESTGVYRFAASEDGKNIAYIDNKNLLHIITIGENCTDKIIAENADHGDYLLCESSNRVYYYENYTANDPYDNKRMWNGTESIGTDNNFANSFEYRNRIMLLTYDIEPTNIEGVSEHSKYLTAYTTVNSQEGTYRYEITKAGLANPTLVNTKNYYECFVSDDGIACTYVDNKKLGLFINDEFIEIDGCISGENTFTENTVYFVRDNSLYKYDTENGESGPIASNVSQYAYTCKNGACLYISDNDLYIIEKDEPIIKGTNSVKLYS